MQCHYTAFENDVCLEENCVKTGYNNMNYIIRCIII